MNKIPVINFQGEEVGQVTLPESVFGQKVNQPLMNQAVRVYLSNQRQSTAKTKTRSEVSLTTKKAYRQKGTGNARHGAKSAPIYVGGGVSHGPTGMENYKLKMSAKMRKAALFSSLSWMAQNNSIVVLENADGLKGLAKEASNFLKSIELAAKKSALVVTNPGINVVRAWKNIGTSRILRAEMLNTYAVLNSGKLIIDRATVDFLAKFYAGDNVQAKESKKATKVTLANVEEHDVTDAKKEAKTTKKVETKAKAEPKVETKSKSEVKEAKPTKETKPKTTKVTKAKTK